MKKNLAFSRTNKYNAGLFAKGSGLLLLLLLLLLFFFPTTRPKNGVIKTETQKNAGLFPISFDHLFPNLDNTHNYDTRNKTKYHFEIHKTKSVLTDGQNYGIHNNLSLLHETNNGI